MKNALLLTLLFVFMFGCAGETTRNQKELPKDVALKYEQMILNKQFKQAEKALEEELSKNPENVQAVQYLGQLHYQQKNYQKSLEYYSRLLKLAQPKAETYFHIGENFQQLKNFYSAISHYNKAIQLNPMLTEAYLKIGDIYLEWNKFEIASRWYEKGVANDRKSASAFYHIANLNYDTAQYEKALKLTKQSLEIDPRMLETRILELKILNSLKKETELATKIKVFIQDFPANADGYLFLGRFYLDLKDYKLSLSNYSKAVEVAPENAASYNGMGNYYYELKQFDNAAKFYTKALELNPNFAYVYFNLGLVNWKQNKFKNAIDFFMKSYELSLEFKEAFLFSGVCSFLAKDEEKAVYYFTEFYKKDAAMFNQYLKTQEYGPIIGQMVQYFFKYNAKESSLNRALYLSMMENPEKASIMLAKENDSFAVFLLARLYFLKQPLREKDKEIGKNYFFKYLQAEKSSIQTILLDSSFNQVKGEDWFLKALEKID